MILKKNKFGFIQGRLTKQKKKIQQFPFNNWKKEFAQAKKLNLDFIEWTIDHYGFYKNPLLDLKKVNIIKSLTTKYGITISSVTADFFMEKPFWKQKNYKYYLNKIKLLVKLCSLHNIKFIIVPLVDNSSINSNVLEKKIIYQFKTLNNLLKKQKVMILFESDFGPRKLLKFIKNFDQYNFGINYDLGNSASLSFNIDEEFRLYGKFIKNIHIKDRMKGGKTVRLGLGNADFDRFFTLLKKINYKNHLIFQTARSLIKGNDFNELKLNIEFIKKYL